MKSKRLIELIKTKDLVIPSALLINYKELGLNEKELIFVALLMSYNNDVIFDPALFSKSLNFDTNEIMKLISDLSSKKYIDIVVKKENGKMREFIDLNMLYEKLLLFTIDEDEIEESQESTIYNMIETEFGRTLSPIEYETISGWLNAKIDEGLIKEALKETVLNGVNNLKYMDKILYEWTKKGYKKASDVRKKTKKEENEIELFSYDWLDDND
jgi:DNA replication protein